MRQCNHRDPGNYDSVVINRLHDEHSTEPSLSGFLANFCTDVPGIAVDAAGVKRETMDRPGVYFTLDAPFVSIIGLFTNALEGPGIISPRGLDRTEAASLRQDGSRRTRAAMRELEGQPQKPAAQVIRNARDHDGMFAIRSPGASRRLEGPPLEEAKSLRKLAC